MFKQQNDEQATKENIKDIKDKADVQKVEGLGDVVAKVTRATGIDVIVKKLAGDDCGCEERRKSLNEKFPFKKK